MPRTKMKPGKKNPAKGEANSHPVPSPDVLTLAEAAAYLRVPNEEVLRLVGPQGLPGRMIGTEWRFLKSALQEWLRTPPAPSSPEALRSLVGAWKDDPHLEEMLQEIYRRRGRPETEDGE